MHILLAVVGVLFVVAGFVGLVGGVISIVLWALAAVCIFFAARLWFKRSSGSASRGPRATP